ncbi:YfbU family protein [Rhodococcus sp. USK13]|uniref:YfbU family protein n=1 Tax=Rhodococcus sp. USK13 TaxID=2806442 RepID=UPI001BCCBC63|nr:YfbU family protein [Rhodococcus sp. USK13]
MASITIRVDEKTRAELESLAKAKDRNVSDLLRATIDQVLGRNSQLKDPDAPSSLAPSDRLLLAQQREILAALTADEEEKAEHLLLAEALREGYAGEYQRVFGYVEPELDLNHCQLVWDLLDMFRVLDASIANLTTEEVAALGDRARWAKFSGFDLSDPVEGPMLGYLRYLVRTGRWTEIKGRLAEIGNEGHSHARNLPAYERMLAVFKPIWDDVIRRQGHGGRYLLTAQQVHQVGNAWSLKPRLH